jgi:hypothetical protein
MEIIQPPKILADILASIVVKDTEIGLEPDTRAISKAVKLCLVEVDLLTLIRQITSIIPIISSINNKCRNFHRQVRVKTAIITVN